MILYYRRGEDIRLTIQDLISQSAPPHEVVIVDNGSLDNVVERLAAEFPTLRLVVSPENEGYAGGMRQGFDALSEPAQWVLFLTHEVRLGPDTLSEMLKATSDEVTAVGPILRLDGTVETPWSAGGSFSWGGRTRHLNEPMSDRPYDVEWLDGCCILADSRYARDSLDDRYFLYWEDVDICRSLARHGRVLVAPAAFAAQNTGMMPVYFAARNRIMYWVKWRSARRVIIASAMGIAAAAAKDATRGSKGLRVAHQRIAGVWDGLTGRRREFSTYLREPGGRR